MRALIRDKQDSTCIAISVDVACQEPATNKLFLYSGPHAFVVEELDSWLLNSTIEDLFTKGAVDLSNYPGGWYEESDNEGTEDDV